MTTVRDAITVGMLEPGSAADRELVERLTDLVNAVYAVAERGMWRDGSARTTPAELAGLIGAGEIGVARKVSGELVGCVRVRTVQPDVGEFGMLAADPGHRGAGIGRALKDLAERHAAECGARTMQLELLVPQEWRHPSKDFLAAWYRRCGYRLVGVDRFDAAYPHLAPRLATPCDLQVHRRPLTGTG